MAQTMIFSRCFTVSVGATLELLCAQTRSFWRFRRWNISKEDSSLNSTHRQSWVDQFLRSWANASRLIFRALVSFGWQGCLSGLRGRHLVKQLWTVVLDTR